jgi:hypothetical protein
LPHPPATRPARSAARDGPARVMALAISAQRDDNGFDSQGE